MSPTPQVNIRIALEAHELIRRIGELIRRRPDMVPALERSVCDLERLAESLEPPTPGAGGWMVVEELEAAVGNLARRVGALEALERAAVPPGRMEPLPPRPKSTLAQLRRKAGLPVP